MIVFEVIRWKNFLSTGNQWTVIPLNKSSSTLIVGENGAGKSTLLDALSFVLYGKPYRDINKPQLVNSINNKDLVVEIEFKIKNNQYKIIRGIKPAIFEIYCNDKLVDQDSRVKEYQDYLEKNILGWNHKSFTQIVVIGSAGFTPFMQLKSWERRGVIEDLLDIQIFGKMFTLLKEKVSRNKESLANAKYQVDLAQERIKLIQKHLNQIRSLKRLDKTKKEKKIKNLENKLKQTEKKIEKYQTEIQNLKDTILDKQKVLKRKEELSELKVALTHKVERLSNDISFFHDQDVCPTCQREIDNEFKEGKINEKAESKEKVSQGLKELISQLDGTEMRLSHIQQVEKKIGDKKIDLWSYMTTEKSLKDDINEIRKELKETEKIKETEDLADLKEAKKALKTHNEEYKELIKQRELYTNAAALLKDDGIKARIIKQYVPIINKLVNKYLAILDFFVQFELDTQFNEKIRSRFRDEFTYSSFSEGEKMRIDLALLFTWRAVSKMRSSTSTNILIFDEIFDSSLDGNGTEEFLKIITELDKDTNTFVISHKGDQFFDKFDDIIKFEKIKNFSFIA